MTTMKDQPTLFEIERAPRFAEEVTPQDVFKAWVGRAKAASVVKPRGDKEPFRRIEIPDVELSCLLRLMAEEPKE